jgi:hypothetical protein
MATSKQQNKESVKEENKVPVMQELSTPRPGEPKHNRIEYPDGTVREDN